jgi:Fe-S-cluster containining protein
VKFKNVKPENLFECQKCGDCCKGYGGTYVTADDINKISNYIGVPSREFKTKYCTLSNNKPLLIQKSDGYCVFWDAMCTIHPVKPKMCRAWPFIRSILVDPDNWNLMASLCPGMRTDYPDDVIANCVRKKIESDS